MNESLLESEDIIISRRGNNFVLKTALRKYGTSVIKSAPVKRKDAEQPLKKISSDCGNIKKINFLQTSGHSVNIFLTLQTSLLSMGLKNLQENRFYPMLK